MWEVLLKWNVIDRVDALTDYIVCTSLTVVSPISPTGSPSFFDSVKSIKRVLKYTSINQVSLHVKDSFITSTGDTVHQYKGLTLCRSTQPFGRNDFFCHDIC